MPLNEPGNWKYFVSHVQRECKLEAVELANTWGKQHCWLDRYMEDKSAAAMEEGVKGSETFVCILSEGYFQSKYCCNEMRWALENEKPIVSTYKNGVNVGALLNTAPDDFRERIMAIDSIALTTGDPDYFDVGMSKITKRLGKLSVAPAAQAPVQPVQKPPQPAVLAKDGTDITALVALIRDGNDAQKEEAAGALRMLAICADNQILIAQADGIPPLVADPANGWVLLHSGWIPSFKASIDPWIAEKGQIVTNPKAVAPYQQVYLEGTRGTRQTREAGLRRVLTLDRQVSTSSPWPGRPSSSEQAFSPDFTVVDESYYAGDTVTRPLYNGPIRGHANRASGPNTAAGWQELHWVNGSLGRGRFIIRHDQIHMCEDYMRVGGETDNPRLGQYARVWVRNSTVKPREDELPRAGSW